MIPISRHASQFVAPICLLFIPFVHRFVCISSSGCGPVSSCFSAVFAHSRLVANWPLLERSLDWYNYNDRIPLVILKLKVLFVGSPHTGIVAVVVELMTTLAKPSPIILLRLHFCVTRLGTQYEEYMICFCVCAASMSPIGNGQLV